MYSIEETKKNQHDLTAEEKAVLDLLENPNDPKKDQLFTWDEDLQRKLLAACLLKPECMERWALLINPDAFLEVANRSIFRVALAYWKTYHAVPPVPILREELKKHFGETEAGETAALLCLTQLRTLIDYFDTRGEDEIVYLDKQLNKWNERLVLQQGLKEIHDCVKKGESVVAKLLALAEKVKGNNTDNTTYRFSPLTSAEFARANYKATWLVKKLIVQGQPGLIGGRKKTLKTSVLVDLAISLGTGTPFLAHFDVPHPRRTAIISGESGEFTLQETAIRVCDSKGIDLESVDCLWDFRLPQLSVLEQLAELSQGLKARQVEVAIIDPLYLCLLAGNDKNAANLYDMGPLLLAVSQACLSVGCTPLLCHHARKLQAANKFDQYEPLDLDDLAFSGVQEFARQWILMSRRQPYEHGSGQHDLWLVAGGSIGHGSIWSVTINEGVLAEDFTGRVWQPVVMSRSQAIEAKAEAKLEAKAEKLLTEQQQVEQAVRNYPTNKVPTKRALATALGWGHDRTERIITRMVEAGTLVIVPGMVNGREYEAVRLAAAA